MWKRVATIGILASMAAGCASPGARAADGRREWSSEIDHPYLPLSAIRYADYRSEDERLEAEVLGLTKVVAGVECLVLAERHYEDGVLVEISYNYFAQDADGAVWYFGEDVDEFRDGVVTGHGGAWLAGRDAEGACLFMPAEPRLGEQFQRENAPPKAQEWDVIEALDATIQVPIGRFTSVMVVAESDRPGRVEERKYYVRGLGLVSENGTLNLVSVERGPDR